MEIKKIENGKLGKRNSAFIAFYTKPYHHYQQSEECRKWGEKAWLAKVPLLGVMSRWDARLGFVGGQVDEGESLIEAAVRECKEEINGDIETSQLTLLCSHHMKKKKTGKEQNAHLFICEITPEEMYELQKQSVNSIHSKIECSGFNVVHLVDNAYNNLLVSPWAGTAKEELKILYNSEFFQKSSIDKP